MGLLRHDHSFQGSLQKRRWKDYRSRWQPRKDIIWVLKKSCTYELTEIVTMCTRPVQAQITQLQYAERRRAKIPSPTKMLKAPDSSWERKIWFSLNVWSWKDQPWSSRRSHIQKYMGSRNCTCWVFKKRDWVKSQCWVSKGRDGSYEMKYHRWGRAS